ncbi:MAG: amidohydrolase family protein [Gemmatimonadota bacterium]|nr:amidohydrolase family protein [Gemmatimonadota bacterium]
MKTWLPATLAAAMSLTAFAPGRAQPPVDTTPAAIPGLTAFSGVSTLPMTSDEVLPGQTVVVRDGVILAVGAADALEIPPGANVIDGSGRFLMPGLAEMHAHVPPGADPPRDEVEDILFLYIANGITTIRGMLGSAYQIPLAGEIERGEVLGPNFYVGAPSINGRSAPAPEAAERLVRAHAEAGYHLQKIHPGVSRETWDHMVGVAREVGLTWAGHVPADVGLVHAIETGMSTVDHLDGYVQAIAPEGVLAQVGAGPIRLGGLANGVDEAGLEEIVRLTIEHDVYVVPTMYLWENLYGAPNPDEMLRQPEMRYVSARTREGWRRRAGGGWGTPEDVERYLGLRRRILRMLSDAGAGILMGTDSPQLFNVPGFALHRELQVMAEAGMSNYEILKSGTVTVGEYVASHLGLDGDFGTIAPGRRADLVLLGSNPLDDLVNLFDRVGVMVRGRWVSRAEIDAGLEALAAKHAG